MEDAGLVAYGLTIYSVLPCSQLTEVLRRSGGCCRVREVVSSSHKRLGAVRKHEQAHLGTVSEKSSILILPAGVLPIETSKKTMGRAEVVGAATLDMLGEV